MTDVFFSHKKFNHLSSKGCYNWVSFGSKMHQSHKKVQTYVSVAYGEGIYELLYGETRCEAWGCVQLRGS